MKISNNFNNCFLSYILFFMFVLNCFFFFTFKKTNENLKKDLITYLEAFLITI